MGKIRGQLRVTSQHMELMMRMSGRQSVKITETLGILDHALFTLDKKIGPIQEQVHEILAAINAAGSVMKIGKILESLYFPSMDERFRMVHESAPDTFEWIFDKPELLQEKQAGLSVTFPDWLSRGSGIFHIEGKPGSGKSTLMKFLCEHRTTGDLLRRWAGDKNLIFAQFFFWRIGSAEEKSLDGLIRGLLSGVIRQDTDLANVLFPQHFGPGVSQDPSNVQLGLTDRDIKTAFDRLIADANVLLKHRICFFIDGLDEFDETRGNTYLGLTEKLCEWARLSGGNVKFCVSSRQFNVFSRAFSGEQRITIQIFTEEDIAELVKQRLSNRNLFKTLAEAHPNRCKELVGNLVKYADGVFLWVSVLLNQLEDALANNDPIEMLEMMVNQAPQELDEFFRHILGTIPGRYRKNALAVLAIAMRMAGILLADEKRQQPYKRFDEIIASEPQHLLLYSCSYLFKALETATLQDLGDTAPLPPLEDMAVSRPEVAALIEATGARVAAQCRGLVERDGGQVRFTHRSIPEFLQRYFSVSSTDHSFNDEDVSVALAWLAAVEMRCGIDIHELSTLSWVLDPTDLYVNMDERADRLMHLVACIRQDKLEKPERVCRLLQATDSALLWKTVGSRSPAAVTPASELPGNDAPGFVIDYAGGLTTLFPKNTNVMGLAAIMGLHEYLAWDLQGAETSFLKEPWYLTNVMGSLVLMNLHEREVPLEEFRGFALQALVQNRVSLGSHLPVLATEDTPYTTSTTLWQGLLSNLLFKAGSITSLRVLRRSQSKVTAVEPGRHCWANIETCLRAGADPASVRFWVGIADGMPTHLTMIDQSFQRPAAPTGPSGERDDRENSPLLSRRHSHDRDVSGFDDSIIGYLVDKEASLRELPDSVLTTLGTMIKSDTPDMYKPDLSFEDFVRWWSPYNSETLLDLCKRNRGLPKRDGQCVVLAGTSGPESTPAQDVKGQHLTDSNPPAGDIGERHGRLRRAAWVLSSKFGIEALQPESFTHARAQMLGLLYSLRICFVGASDRGLQILEMIRRMYEVP